jgi:hypothetical protein
VRFIRPLQRLEVSSKDLSKKCPLIIKHISDRVPGTPWYKDPFTAQCLIDGLTGDGLHRIQSVLTFAKSHKWDATGQLMRKAHSLLGRTATSSSR